MKELSEGDRERIVNAVVEGKSSEYWIYLKKQIEEWKRQEERFLDGFKRKGMDKGDIDAYNRAIDRMDYLGKFLDINEILINFNMNILERTKKVVKETYHEVESFLKAI